MSNTSLITFRNGKADTAHVFRNSWGGAARIWQAIWDRYGTKTHEYDNFLAAAGDGRLWQLYDTADLTEDEKWVYLFTCDNNLVAKKDFARLAVAMRAFAQKYPTTGVCHLNAWADVLEKSDAEAIGLYATSVTENPWCEYDEDTDETTPYDFTTGDRHSWIGDEFKAAQPAEGLTENV